MNKKLSDFEKSVLFNKATEPPFTGDYYKHFEKGSYHCKNCDALLFLSKHKFDSSCGWPAFDDEVQNAIKHVPDADGRRTEIVCANCGAHLGHVFIGEQLTEKNVRHCVNSISMTFKEKETAYFASGCFWGTEYHLQKCDGVLSTTVGYMGGFAVNPTYEQVCTGTTDHLETVKVEFDPNKVSYETLAKLFFETHDQSQEGGQGPDIGSQYESGVFYSSLEQKETIEKLITILKNKDFGVVTKLIDAKDHPFWEAEDYHKNYYENNGNTPYCHIFKKKFD